MSTRAERRAIKRQLTRVLKPANILDRRKKERQQIIEASINDMTARKFSNVTEHSILHDPVHSSVFAGILREHLGRSLDIVIYDLLKEIAKNVQKQKAEASTAAPGRSA